MKPASKCNGSKATLDVKLRRNINDASSATSDASVTLKFAAPPEISERYNKKLSFISSSWPVEVADQKDKGRVALKWRSEVMQN